MPKFENGYCVINRIDGGSTFLVFMGRLFFNQTMGSFLTVTKNQRIHEITSPQNSKKPHNPQKLAWTNLMIPQYWSSFDMKFMSKI